MPVMSTLARNKVRHTVPTVGASIRAAATTAWSVVGTMHGISPVSAISIRACRTASAATAAILRVNTVTATAAGILRRTNAVCG